jgi:hypothetical protein
MVAIAAIIEEPTDMPYRAYIVRYMRADRALRDGLKRGLEDIKHGRTTSWGEVRRELGID